jgi:hypothetical protein
MLPLATLSAMTAGSRSFGKRFAGKRQPALTLNQAGDEQQ